MENEKKIYFYSIFKVILMILSCILISLMSISSIIPVKNTKINSGWKIIKTINFNNIPKNNLKGDIKKEYLYFAVTMAGFHNEKFGFTIGPDDDVRYTNDGGKSWTKAKSDVNCRFGLDIVNENIAWHSGNGGTRVTINGGQSWKTVKPSVYPYMSFLNDKTGWTASPLILQKTIDGGETWTDIKLPANIQNIAAISLNTINIGYILDTAGNLFITYDGGQNWNVKSLNFKNNEQLIFTKTPYAVMRFVNELTGIVIFDLPDGSVWFMNTIDGGKTWKRSEIKELKNQSYYYKLYLSNDGKFLTATDDFQGTHTCIVMNYQQTH